MSAGGVEVKKECVTSYEDLKLEKYRYVLCSLSDDLRSVGVVKTAERGATYDDFVKDLKSAGDLKQCRYGVFDWEYAAEGGKHSKRIFFLWNPDQASIKQKMASTSSKEAFRKQLVGIGTEIQAVSHADLDSSRIQEAVSRK